jgi:uncharacterized protein YybS (DUF2232 family)
MCVAILPVVPVLLVPFLALPVAHVTARWGIRIGVIVAMVAAGLMYAGLGASAAAFVFLLTMGMGLSIGTAMRGGWRFSRALAFTTGGAVSALVLWGLVMWLALGVDLTSLKEAAYRAVDDVAAMYQQAGLSEAGARSVSQQLRSLLGVIPYLAPGLAGMGAILVAACSLGLAAVVFPRLRQKISIGWRFAGFRLHWGSAYASIIGLGLLLFSGGEAAWCDVLMYTGINLLLVSQTLFFIQGMAVARWFVATRRLQQGSKVVLYFCAILGQVLLQLTGLVGLLDTWIDCRKRFALKSPGAGLHG